MSVDYAERAAECRRLATQYARPGDWAHFVEMAESWELLLRQQQQKLKQQEELRREQELKQQEELKREEELKQQEELKQEKSRLETIALADRFRNVLSLSDIAADRAAKGNKNEKAA